MRLLILILIINTFMFAQDSVKVEINAAAFGLQDSSLIFICGNNPKLGNWNPSKVELSKINDTLWQKIFYFPKNTELEFKFTKGSWDTEAVNSHGEVPPNEKILAENDTIFSVRITNWRDEFPENIAEQITGNVKYHKNFPSKYVSSRDIVVWLPPSYEINHEKRYPVLYMNDGQNIFDPKTSAFGFEWKIDETADSLIEIGEIDEIIVVGISNTSLRKSEYTQNDTGKIYMSFVVDELKSFIDKNYRTLSDKNNTAVGGSSAGGLISFMLAWEYPEVFSKAASLSPAFKIEHIDYVDDVTNYTGSKKDILFYIDNGGVGIEQRLQPGVDEMLNALISKGYKLGKDVIYFLDDNAEHTEVEWGKRSHKFLKLFFGISK